MIRFERVSVAYPDGVAALSDVSLEVAAGEIAALVGASGSGKTTLLRLVNRLVEPSSGRVLLRGRPAVELDPIPLRRSIGYAVQDAGLIAHMTVGQNAALVPRLLGWEAGRISQAVRRALELVRLEPGVFEHRTPASLSGGQRQRAGLARALAADQELLLMDEPFGALDAALREELQDEFRDIARRLGKTVLFVTHDMHEAAHLADRIAVLRDGRLLQHGAPEEIVLKPADAFVARLLGRRRLDLENSLRRRP